MSSTQLTLKLLPSTFGICKLDAQSPIPAWVPITSSDFCSITKTNDELSIVCTEQSIPENIPAERGWRILKVLGPLDFSLTGILSQLISPLAENKISIFAVSTYDTDYILIKNNNIDRAVELLKRTYIIIQ